MMLSAIIKEFFKYAKWHDYLFYIGVSVLFIYDLTLSNYRIAWFELSTLFLMMLGNYEHNELKNYRDRG